MNKTENKHVNQLTTQMYLKTRFIEKLTYISNVLKILLYPHFSLYIVNSAVCQQTL